MIKVTNAQRTSRQYTADLELDGKRIGRIERGFIQGGYHADDYHAFVGTTRLTTARTLRDLRDDLRDAEIVADIRDALEEPSEQIAEGVHVTSLTDEQLNDPAVRAGVRAVFMAWRGSYSPGEIDQVVLDNDRTLAEMLADHPMRVIRTHGSYFTVEVTTWDVELGSLEGARTFHAWIADPERDKYSRIVEVMSDLRELDASVRESSWRRLYDEEVQASR